MFLHLFVILFTGEESLSKGGLCSGVSVQGEGVSVQGGGSLSGRPPYSTEPAVCILLVCILVFFYKYAVKGILPSNKNPLSVISLAIANTFTVIFNNRSIVFESCMIT